MKMQVESIHTENTGGGCMITYVDVKHCDNVIQFGIDEECIVAYDARYGDTEDCMSEHYVWAAYSYKELTERLSYDEADQLVKTLIEYCFRFKIHPTFEFNNTDWQKYQLQFIEKNTCHQQHLDIIAFIRALDKIAAEGNNRALSIVASIQPRGEGVMLDIDADVYTAMRNMLFDVITPDFF